MSLKKKTIRDVYIPRPMFERLKKAADAQFKNVGELLVEGLKARVDDGSITTLPPAPDFWCQPQEPVELHLPVDLDARFAKATGGDKSDGILLDLAHDVAVRAAINSAGQSRHRS